MSDLKMDPVTAKAYKPEPHLFNYTARDTIIYALSVGAVPENDLHFLYENHDNFQILPTYVVAPGLITYSLSKWPGIPVNLTRILHGEQYIEILEPLPPGDGELRVEAELVDILDKGSSAYMIFEVTIFDNKTNKKHCIMQYGIFQMGSGNFGGAKANSRERKVVAVPVDKSPKTLAEAKIHEEQAAFYRQTSGDLNPLHIDPQFAKMAGFDKPIFHGMGSLGIVTKKVLETYGANETVNFKAIKARFSAPVLPGQTLVIETWPAGNRIHVQAKVKETGKMVISNSYVDLYKTGNAASSSVTAGPAQANVKSAEIFKKIGEELTANKDLVSKINAIILYDITSAGKLVASFTLDLKNSPFHVYTGKPKNGDKPSVTVIVDDNDFVQLADGKLDGIKAFMSGRLKIRGNVMLMQRLQQILAKARNTSKL